MGRSLFDNRDITEKRKGWDMYHVSQSLGNKVKGIEMVIQSHYERSKEAYGNDHPDFKTYIKHWLRAQQECDLIDTYTMASLILRHGRDDQRD